MLHGSPFPSPPGVGVSACRPGVWGAVLRLTARRRSTAVRILAPAWVYFELPAMGCVKLVLFFLTELLTETNLKIQHYTVDHLARGSMKNAANCASECELQDT